MDRQVRQRRQPRLARPGTGTSQRQKGLAFERPADLAVVGTELIDEALVERSHGFSVRYLVIVGQAPSVRATVVHLRNRGARSAPLSAGSGVARHIHITRQSVQAFTDAAAADRWTGGQGGVVGMSNGMWRHRPPWRPVEGHCARSRDPRRGDQTVPFAGSGKHTHGGENPAMTRRRSAHRSLRPQSKSFG